MSARAVRQAFRSELAAAISSGAISAPFLETVNRKVRNEDRPDEWITAEFFGGEEEQVGTGAATERLFRERGAVFFHVLTLAGKGDDRAIEIADEIRAVFRAAKLAGGTTVERVAPPDTGDGDDDGTFFRASVEIQYRHELTA
jgi:hypothetical protein